MAVEGTEKVVLKETRVSELVAGGGGVRNGGPWWWEGGRRAGGARQGAGKSFGGTGDSRKFTVPGREERELFWVHVDGVTLRG